MKVTYLGTGSAEGVPAIFCQCKACRQAVMLGGKNLRGRNQVLIDRQLLIDFSPDTYLNQWRFPDFDSRYITQLLITHTHSDHFHLTDLLQRETVSNQQILQIYGSSIIGEKLGKLVQNSTNLHFQEVFPFQIYEIGDYTVIPLKANHSKKEACLNYLIEKDEVVFLYLHDTGPLTESTWQFLTSYSKQISAISFDCNQQFSEEKSTTHMNVAANIAVTRKLRQYQLLVESPLLILSHFSHKYTMPHEVFAEKVATYHFLPAYDGYSFTL